MKPTYATLTFVLLAMAPLPALEVQTDIQYKMTPQGPLALDLYMPSAKNSAPRPLVVYTHGGGWAAGSKDGAKAGSMRKVVEGLTENGFCVASIDYRLYTKDGDVTIKDCMTDCKDAVRYLAKNAGELRLDPTRVFTFGDSAGGQIAQMLLLTPPELFPGASELADASYTMIAGVSWYGPCDFEKTELFNHDGRADFRDRFGPRILPPGSDPKDKLRLYREMSPVNYLKADGPPLLMIQGDQDTTIPVHHARYMQERAETIGAPVKVVIVANAGHNWREVGAAIKPTQEEIVAGTVKFFVEQAKRCPAKHFWKQIVGPSHYSHDRRFVRNPALALGACADAVCSTRGGGSGLRSGAAAFFFRCRRCSAGDVFDRVTKKDSPANGTSSSIARLLSGS